MKNILGFAIVGLFFFTSCLTLLPQPEESQIQHSEYVVTKSLYPAVLKVFSEQQKPALAKAAFGTFDMNKDVYIIENVYTNESGDRLYEISIRKNADNMLEITGQNLKYWYMGDYTKSDNWRGTGKDELVANLQKQIIACLENDAVYNQAKQIALTSDIVLSNAVIGNTSLQQTDFINSQMIGSQVALRYPVLNVSENTNPNFPGYKYEILSAKINSYRVMANFYIYTNDEAAASIDKGLIYSVTGTIRDWQRLLAPYGDFYIVE